MQKREIAEMLEENSKRNWQRKVVQKTFYRYVNSMKKVKVNMADLKRKDGTFTNSDTEKANELNRFFKSVFTVENGDNIPTLDKRTYTTNLSEIIVYLQ